MWSSSRITMSFGETAAVFNPSLGGDTPAIVGAKNGPGNRNAGRDRSVVRTRAREGMGLQRGKVRGSQAGVLFVYFALLTYIQKSAKCRRPKVLESRKLSDQCISAEIIDFMETAPKQILPRLSGKNARNLLSACLLGLHSKSCGNLNLPVRGNSAVRR